MKKILKSVISLSGLVLLITIVLVVKVQAQPNPGPGNQGNATGPTTDGPTVPFDGGMSLILLASGIGYGTKKLRKR